MEGEHKGAMGKWQKILFGEYKFSPIEGDPLRFRRRTYDAKSWNI